jgi:hypothetical protein
MCGVLVSCVMEPAGTNHAKHVLAKVRCEAADRLRVLVEVMQPLDEVIPCTRAAVNRACCSSLPVYWRGFMLRDAALQALAILLVQSVMLMAVRRRNVFAAHSSTVCQ